jgi:catechol 2,3-dioxygenase-like lactoylglutathione lyase family enzyme
VERRKVKERVMFKRIDHVEIVTDELDRTLRFYTDDALGFTLKVRENHAQTDHRSQRISRTLD